ncbi:MAG: hypothetical protein KAT58_08000, partial [candidate division Zixibacteria bacterium]|nr:hypothetical protein [candidate division Zixibacteria bacterium]
VGTAPYLNAGSPVAIITTQTQSAANLLDIGGGNAYMDAVTGITFYTAAAVATPTGTQAMSINASGVVGIGPFDADLGTGLHIKVSDTFAAANASANNLVIEENSTAAGMSIFSAVAGKCSIYFGSSAHSTAGRIVYDNLADDMLFATLNGATAMRLENDQTVVVGPGASGTSGTGLDIQDGGITLLLGADNVAKTRTNLVSKFSRIASAHYTNAEEPVGLIRGGSTATENKVYIGGGSITVNAATDIELYTAADNTTVTGTKQLSIDGQGVMLLNSQMGQMAITTETPTGTTQTIDWDNGNVEIIDLASATGNVTLTLSNPEIGARYEIKVIQDATTPRNLVWPAAVKWPGGTAPTISAGASAVDWIYLTYDGTNYGGRFEQNLS